jgi:nucleoside-diphosphate-sugar epimerase
MIDLTPHPKRVLVSGSTGAVGMPVCARLMERGHFVRGFARRPTEGVNECVQGDLNDRTKVREAVDGMDAIVHLGAWPDIGDFIDDILQPNVVGLYYICEAAREVDVDRLILGSSLRSVSGRRANDLPIAADAYPCPQDDYALTKAWMEIAGEMYARMYGLSVINARIGWLPRHREGAERLMSASNGPDLFLSHDDAGRFFERAVESERPARGECVTLFVTSWPKTTERLDLGPSREVIGYEPVDTWPEGLPFDVSGLA